MVATSRNAVGAANGLQLRGVCLPAGNGPDFLLDARGFGAGRCTEIAARLAGA